MAQLHKIAFPPAIMARGFWLYAWKIMARGNKRFCYVGMTGDVTGVAQSPFNRAAAHFGSNENANAIKRYLLSHGFEPENCDSFTYLVYGPVQRYWHATPPALRHKDFDESRKRVGALERQLWTVAEAAGYTMLNSRPRFATTFDKRLWRGVHAAFSSHLGL
jgi:hypothetical protein